MVILYGFWLVKSHEDPQIQTQEPWCQRSHHHRDLLRERSQQRVPQRDPDGTPHEMAG